MAVNSKQKKSKDKTEVLTKDLRMLQRYIETLWRFLPIPICDVNGAFVIINVDRKFAEFFGYAPEEIIGTSVEKLFKYPEVFEEIKKKLLKKGVIFNKEAIVLAKKNQEVPVSIFGEAREDQEGFTISYFLALIDVGKVKKKEKDLQDKINELERFQKLAIGRELRMAELKKEIERLKEITKNQREIKI